MIYQCRHYQFPLYMIMKLTLSLKRRKQMGRNERNRKIWLKVCEYSINYSPDKFKIISKQKNEEKISPILYYYSINVSRYFSTDGHLNCFLFFAIINFAILIHIFWGIWEGSLSVYSRRELRNYKACIINLLKKHKTASHLQLCKRPCLFTIFPILKLSTF